jgi:hypothetical protein
VNQNQAKNLCGTMLPDEEYGAATASWVAVVDDTRRAGTHSRTSVAVPQRVHCSGRSRRQSRAGSSREPVLAIRETL